VIPDPEVDGEWPALKSWSHKNTVCLDLTERLNFWLEVEFPTKVDKM
jgi:hypothetical protein